jgi:RNA polymerase sigma factor for flagellar operon FliA
MGLSPGIQKYREASKSLSKAKADKTRSDKAKVDDVVERSAASKTTGAKKTSPSKSASTAVSEKDVVKTLKAAKNGKIHEARDAEVSANAKKKAAKKLSEKAAATEEVDESVESGEELALEALDAQEDSAAPGDVELQKELEDEIERDAVQTSSLVKEDYSPVNSTRDRLVVEYAPLIKYIAQKIAARLPTNIELDDLMSSGVIGLMDAIEKYDASRDNKFKTYAEFRIRGAILDELRAQDWVPRSVREKAKTLERCYARIEQQKGRQATDEEVCQDLGVSQEEYHEMLNQVRSVSLLSFDDVQNFSKADKRALHGFSDSSNYKSPTPFSEVNHASLKRMISEAINDLPEKQRLVLSLYYYEDLNLKEIGRVLDVTESRVSQLHTQAILRLKGKLRNNWDEFLVLFGAGGL